MTELWRPGAPVIDVHLDEADIARQLPSDVRAGLSQRPYTLAPRWFYDARGSELYEQITRLAEYYPFRAEREILLDRAPAIAAEAGADTLVELGSGSSEKTRILLSAMGAAGLARYVPVDVSQSALRAAAADVAAEYPGVCVHGVVGDFIRHLHLLPPGGKRLMAFLGGTIGNLEPVQRHAFLRDLRDTLRPGELLLLGTDLVKSPAVLVPAYDDARGVTAEFNRNVLRVLNRELGADFPVEQFEHRAVWDAEQQWIEMRLRARAPLTVTIPGASLRLDLDAGEEIRTEVSCKFTPDRLDRELSAAGFSPSARWTDSGGRYAVTLAAAA